MANYKRKLVNLVVDRYVNLELFYRKQQPASNGCIEWTGVKNNVGYGFIGYRDVDPETGAPQVSSGGMMTTHRLAWMIAHGRLPTLRNINHTCHNKLCVNPDHLTEGTQEDKLRAMIKDGIRGGRPAGVPLGHRLAKQHREYKYTEDEIQWIRTADTKDIAQRYNVSRTRACCMRNGFRSSYKWLPCPPFEPGKVGKPRKEKK
jgi:hypothetical protein